ncbi:FAD-dependent oxidoreductase [Jannaschia formosa]|uniref:FAD-dependent oxidoreductase n=1 Tax=Jannaschia formosa TaxID=2259592 RepID=UPI000E1B8756|nr:FAD-dependent oxidoreductase [Jannaschia formosa]TFL18493.1 FAD-dependent oxidoreductase [Jannaschia formosa]
MTLRFTFEGETIPARPGDSLAAALSAAGHVTTGARRSGAPRAAFCGMGVCHDCLVTVDGARGRRSCMVEVRDGMEVRREAERELAAGTRPPAPPAFDTAETEIAVIGAGPAGLSAAIHAAKAGASVLVLDERGEPGGQYFKPRSEGYRGGHAPDRQHRRGAALRAEAEAAGIRILSGQSLWFARAEGDGFALRSLGDAGGWRMTARAVILATGAYERPAMAPGWTLPGAMTIGAAQTLARRYGVAPGARVLIAGHGPLGLQLAAELDAIGARVVALAERGRPAPGPTLARAALSAPRLAADGARYRLAVLRARTAVLTGWDLAKIEGIDRAETAVIRRIATGETRRFAADIIAAGDGFAPQLELARLLGVPVATHPATGEIRPERDDEGRTPVPGVWIAGDAGGLGGAEMALAQGVLSAAGALAHLGRAGGETGAARKGLARARSFQSALWSLYAAPARPAPVGQTILCRCEEITAATARAAIAGGADDPAKLKRATRLGMGRCQGRYCLPQALRLLAEAGHPAPPEALFAPQIPARPVPLGALALEKPEWGGHRQSAPSVRPGRPDERPLSVTSADLVVIGGGVTGISAALHAARAGASVLCLDRGRVNGEASGGNAGSLHLQLLSWDFGGKAVGSGDLQLRTLPLQAESIDLWQKLERELAADFEMAVTGGLMVAENPAQIAFLEAKAAAEARVGIRTEVIDGDRVRRIAPAISQDIVAAAWCPGEGKINPLAATPPLAAAARAAGAVIEENAPVRAIARDGAGYTIDTARGRITARRILIAAGGWSAQVARMLGADLPIKGAPLQMVVTAPGPTLVPCLLAHADRHLSMKQTAAGSVIIGGAWPAVTGAAGQAEILPESLEGNLWVAARTVPQVGSLQVIRSWAAMNIDIDGAPLIGPVPGLDGVTVAATANGYTLGPLMGREAAAAALTGRLRQDLEAFSMSRFS